MLKNIPENKLLYIHYLFIAIILVLIGYCIYPIINKKSMQSAEEKNSSKTHIKPSETKKGWVTYTNEELKYKISFPDNWKSDNLDLSDHFGVKNFIPIEDFYENRLDKLYFLSVDDLNYTAVGVEVYPSDNVLISKIKKNIAEKNMDKEVDPEAKKIFSSAFFDIDREDLFAEGITSNPYRDGGIDRTKYLFVSRYGNIYVLMFTTTHHAGSSERDLKNMSETVNPVFKEILDSFENYRINLNLAPPNL